MLHNSVIWMENPGGDETMKAVVIRAPMDFVLEDVPVPEIPEAGLLVKVLYCGLCGSDLRTIRSGHRKVTFPWIIGHEISGLVVETGPLCKTGIRKGDTIAIGPLAYCGRCDFCIAGSYELCEGYREIGQVWHGGFAEYVAIPEECVNLGNIIPVPPGMDPAFASITEPVSSCINAQEKGHIGLGDTVVIIGSGPVGCIHIALARTRGADTIIIADISEQRLAYAEAFGPDALINAEKTDLVEEIMRVTGGKGADVVITATPAPSAPAQALAMARKGGRILLFGGLPKDKSNPGINLNVLHYKALSLMGTTIFAPRHQKLALKLVESGRVPADRLISHTFDLAQFEEGVELAMQGKVLKALFKP